MRPDPGFRRWLGGTSNRTFILWPILLFAFEALIQQGWPRVHVIGLPFLAWGYLQYKLAGIYRTREGGGGPGMSKPPVRIVDRGIYAWTRNPMYLGHLIFYLGLALTLASWAGALVLAAHVFWFDHHAREDEARLVELFGDPYRDYVRRVKRWVPGVY